MGKNPQQLTQSQVDVLRWIRDGCPAGTYDQGYNHRIIARALERRGLVTVSGHGASWRADITDAGVAWDAAPPAAVLPSESEADRLVERVLECGGRLVLPEDRDAEKSFERLVRMSLKSPNRPRGKKLEIRGTGTWGQGPKEIIFVQYFDDYVDSVPVPIPARVAKYHGAVRAFLDDREWQDVTAAHVGRAALILQAIAVEAPKRSLEALTKQHATKGVDHHGVRRLSNAQLVLKTTAGLYGLRLREIPAPGAKKVERRWDMPKKQPAWLHNRGWEFTSTGILELIIDGPGSTYNGDRYRDSARSTIEHKLPDVFRSLEIYRLRTEWNQQERRRKEADQRREWEAAMEEAKLRYAEHVRWNHFEERSRDWHAIRQHREFLAAARTAVQSTQPSLLADLTAQLDLAAHRLDELDAIRHPDLLIPDVPDPKADDLKPFLAGWSPYGPDRHGW